MIRAKVKNGQVGGYYFEVSLEAPNQYLRGEQTQKIMEELEKLAKAVSEILEYKNVVEKRVEVVD